MFALQNWFRINCVRISAMVFPRVCQWWPPNGGSSSVGERNSATPLLPQFNPLFTSIEPLFNLFLTGNLEPQFRNHGLQTLGICSLIVQVCFVVSWEVEPLGPQIFEESCRSLQEPLCVPLGMSLQGVPARVHPSARRFEGTPPFQSSWTSAIASDSRSPLSQSSLPCIVCHIKRRATVVRDSLSVGPTGGFLVRVVLGWGGGSQEFRTLKILSAIVRNPSAMSRNSL